jgi:hemoglobin/transferrin/lactoferrin receptor protein
LSFLPITNKPLTIISLNNIFAYFFTLIISFFAFGLGKSVQAQTGIDSQSEEKGQPIVKIVDKASGAVIEFVTIRSVDLTLGMVSTIEGYFALPMSFSLSDTLTFTHASFKKAKMSIGQIKTFGWKVPMTKGIDLTVLNITATRDKRLGETAQKMKIIDSDQIAFEQAGSTADLLQSSGAVFVQKTQGGGGSPVIRGFEANKVLIVVDGVRLNNAIFRSGHLQNVIALDDAVLDRIEVVYGPGSSIYGSDALGGVMQFYTKKPSLSWNDTLNISGTSWLRYATANSEKAGHLQFNVGSKKFGSLTAVTFHDFGDIRSGSVENPFYPNFGKRPSYAESLVQGDSIVDFMVPNEDPDLQVGTGYRQFNLMQKFLYRANEDLDLEAGLHLSTSSDVPRYDRLTATTTIDGFQGDPLDRLTYAEWFYGPQNWTMAYLSADLRKHNAIWDEAKFTIGYQHFDEDRINRRFRAESRNIRKEDVDVLSFNAEFNKRHSDKHNFLYGAEFYYNSVKSAGFTESIITGEINPNSTRYPDGGSEVWSGALYFKHEFKLSEKLLFAEAIRFTQAGLTSEFVDTTFFNFPFSDIRVSSGSLTGSLIGIWTADKNWTISAMAASGFRSPNVDDIAKVFDSSPGNVIVPNDDLGPEDAYNIELTISRTIADKTRISVTGWHTWLIDAIVRGNFQFNGQDSILYDGELSQVQANLNTGSARLAGFSAELETQLTDFIKVKANLNYTYGRDVLENVPLGHIAPVYGLLSAQYHSDLFRIESFIRYNGWKRLDDYSPSGVDNLEEATAQGTPAWYTLNLRGSYKFNDQFEFQLSIENILDRHYRPFSSSISAPGRNFIIGLRGNF